MGKSGTDDDEKIVGKDKFVYGNSNLFPEQACGNFLNFPGSNLPYLLELIRVVPAVVKNPVSSPVPDIPAQETVNLFLLRAMRKSRDFALPSRRSLRSRKKWGRGAVRVLSGIIARTFFPSRSIPESAAAETSLISSSER